MGSGYSKHKKRQGFPCLSAEEGCKEIVAGKDLKGHHEKCDFRPLPCNSCNLKTAGTDNLILMSKYLDHLVNVYHAIYWDGKNGEFNIRMPWPADFPDVPSISADTPGLVITYSGWIPHLVKFHGFTFLLVNIIRDFTLYPWVRIFGNENEANQFHDQVLIESKNIANGAYVSKSSVRWEGQVFQIQPSGSIIDEGKCMATSADYIKRICEPNPGMASGLVWTIKCKLIKKEAEAVAE